MKKSKRILSMLLACLMVLGVCPLAVFAADTAAEPPAQTEAKPYYTYYVQDGLTFLWSGEDYEIGDKEETVKALVNILNPDQKLDKMMYGRQSYNLAKNDGNGNVTFKTMAYKKANGGVVMVGDGNFIYTDIVPMTVIDGVEVLTDMTFEVSQSYFDKIATSTTTTYSCTRGSDGGMAWYGPLGSIGNGKMPYKAMPVGSTLYHYAEYADTNGVAIPFYYLSGKLVATNTEFYTYADGAMTKITDETVIKAIQDQITAQTLTVDGKTANLYRWKGVGNDYSSFLAMDAYGTAGVFQHNTAPLSTMGYDKVGQNQFLNNTINQAFTSTIIFDYAAVAASTKFDFTVGRDGVKYATALAGKDYDATVDKSVGTYFTGTTFTYNNGTPDDTSDDIVLTKGETFLGFIGERDSNHTSGTSLTNMLAYSINDEGRNFAFTFGVNVATVLHSIRMYDRVLTEAELAQNHFVDIAMKLGADLSAYDEILASENADELLPLVHAIAAGKDEGDFTKEEFEVAIKKAATPYYKLYVQDGLVFLWTGEGNELTAVEQKVTAFENLVGEQDITKRSYGRHYSHYYQGQSFTYYKTDKGVQNNGGSSNTGLILTDLVPTRVYNGENILSDMTLEVSQAYPSTYQTKLGGTVNLATRGFDPGYILLGALGNNSYTRVAYKQEYAKNEKGTLRNFVPYYYVPNAYANDASYEAEILYADSSTSGSTKAAFPLYRKNEAGIMVQATTDKHGNPISNVYCSETAKYVADATGKIYYIYDPYYNLSTKDTDKKVTINGNGHIQGGTNLPATDVNGMGPIANWSGTLTTYDYPMWDRANFMNAKQDQAFTTTLIFNYDENATSTSIPFTFTAGRDGAFLNTTNHTYDTTKDYTPAEKKWDNDSKSDDNTTYNADKTVASTETVQKYAFSYGIGTAMTYYAIRLYDRALTAEEQAHNNLVDIAYQLDADLYDYVYAPSQYIKDYVLERVAGTAAADWTKESLEALIAEAYEEAMPTYASLYVQDGLTFLWTGEGNKMGDSAVKTTVTNLLNSEEAITRATNGRMASEYFPGKNADFYPIDNGVLLVSGNAALILNDLIPTRTLTNGAKALADMTVEFSQSYPDYYKTSKNGALTLSTRGFDGGANYFGPVKNVSYTKTLTDAIYANNNWYAPFTYTNPENPADTRIVYVSKSVPQATDGNPVNFPYYAYDAKAGTLTELGTLTLLSTKDAAANPEGNTSSALSPTFSVYGTTNSFASLSPFNADKVGAIMNWNDYRLDNYFDSYGKPQFMNGKANEAFTTTITFDYGYAEDDFDSTTYSYAMGIGRDGTLVKGDVFKGTYDSTVDYSTADSDNDNSNFGFTYGVSTGAVNYYAIRIYDRVLTSDEQAQNNFIDIALQLGLKLNKYDLASAETKAAIHALTAGKAASDFTAEELQTKINFIIAGGEEASEIAASDVITFAGYSIRVRDYAGLRAEFNLDTVAIEAFAANTTAKIKEIGAIVAIKGSYTVEDLTVEGGRQMMKKAIYTDGAYVTNGEGTALTYERKGDTYFALTTTFEKAETQTKANYETELLYRGYVTVSVGDKTFTFYTDMTAPSYDKISMYDVTKVFEENGYAETQTVKDVLAVCAPQA